MPTPPVQVGFRMMLEAIELVAGGDSLSRVEGFPVFVPGLYPGDRASVEITEVRKGFARGAIAELHHLSALRRSTSCPVADTCGGCNWTELRLDAQLAAKRHILFESLRRTGRFDLDSLPVAQLHPSPLEYRLRSRLHAGSPADGNPGSIGFFGKRSHDVVPLPATCEIVGPQLAAAIATLTEAGLAEGEELVAFETSSGLVTHRVGDNAREILVDVETEIPPGTGVSFSYQLSTESFFQVNRHLLGTMIQLVGHAAAGVPSRSLAIDLFAGVGFFTLPLARMFDRVVSVEDSRESYRWALLNAGDTANVRPLQGRVEEVVGELEERAPFILLDPPRAGIRPGAISGIDRLASHTIAYLSCDPVTLARDLRLLSERGWTIVSIDLVDLFPNTHHVETFVVMRR